MLLASLTPRFEALAVAALLSVAACSVTSTGVGFDPPDASAEPSGSSGSSGSSSGSSGGSSGVDAATSCSDPTCPHAICECKDKTLAAPSGVCRSGGSCDVATACDTACGGAGFTGSVLEYKPCSSAISCATSSPNVSCACKQGFGENAYAACKEGYCSPAPQDVCPAACASEGGWAGCTSPADCAPLVCACKDGANPAAGAACTGGVCGPASGQCPALCTSHGGWTGTATNPPDAGTTGPKPPGAACTQGSECTPFDCTCNDASTFKGNKVCQSHLCATKAQACGFVCMSSGGWSGS